MMGERRIGQEALFYEFSLERHVPAEHLLRSIDQFVELDGIRCELVPFYSEIGRPSIDPELMIRMLIVGYCFGIRSERRLCEEVHLNLAYRWFCRLGLDGAVPDHSTFSKNRHGRFRDAAIEPLRSIQRGHFLVGPRFKRPSSDTEVVPSQFKQIPMQQSRRELWLHPCSYR